MPNPPPAPGYAELHCLSNFSFQRGASTAKELFERARRLGYRALAITDECTLAGIVRAYEASRELELPLIVGAEFNLVDGPRFVLLVEDADGYANLCRLITHARRAAEKGEYRLTREDLAAHPRAGLLALLLPDSRQHRFPLPLEGGGQGGGGPDREVGAEESAASTRKSDATRQRGHPHPNPPPSRGRGKSTGQGMKPASTSATAADATTTTAARTSTSRSSSSVSTPADIPTRADAEWLHSLFPQRCWLALELHRGPHDAETTAAMRELSVQAAIPLVACGDVHMHVRRRKALQDTLVAIRLGVPVAAAGYALWPNGERHLRRREDLARQYPADALAESERIAARCRFSLADLRYEYPRELVPQGLSAEAHLRELTEQGLRWRFPLGATAKVRAQVEHELALIAELGYESYFLTVHDIVRYARTQSILCQGRGSAANSAVCYALGITEVDPARMSMLFERFISKERNEPPDIDVDFEHERREEVIQYIYRKYGRQRAALAATVICYRPRSAVRDVGKALGLSLDQLDQVTRALGWWDEAADIGQRLREAGFDPESALIRRLLALSRELLDFPRHLSQHVGGFVISEHPLHELVPVENAAMPDRTVIQWDKDDLDTLGLLKVDCLALGMLTCLHRAFDLLHAHRGLHLTPATVPPEDAETYAMIQRADTLGVFQIESRAQMAMLPRLKPANYYDLVIEVAIVRPGPIQGKMVHPYLRRRQGLEPVTYPSEALREVFGRTLGVPIFQEQVMQLAIVAAGFTPGEADHLRRSMAAWKRRGGLEHFEARILDGMRERGYAGEFAAQVFEQIKGFGSYGFPESHAASFALLVYVSCWLKCHEPAVFACALLNSLPMGFYQPSQIIQDLQRHGVQVRPVDVTHSAWHCTLETEASDSLALRLGYCLLQGISADAAGRIVAARIERPYTDVQDLVDRAALNRFERTRLAEGGALRTLAGHRHRAHWAVAGAESLPAVLDGSAIPEQRVPLRPPTTAENVFGDYARYGFSLERHPLALVRASLRERRALSAQQLGELADGSTARTAGLVTVRQRPGTASGVTFVTLEDETGVVNLVIWLALAQRQRRVLIESTLLAVDGELQVADGVRHLVARRLHDWSGLLEGLDARSRDFH
ncbi:MAG TPA: error-prone DNA polymerase [Pseudomonadota bacterium]|nr:error-prone DNA polymerase [Pseudomonadota bacterium]